MAYIPDLPAAGMLTGGRQAETYRTSAAQDKANLNSTRISNLQNAAEFQDYLAGRQNRNLRRQAENTTYRNTIATENEALQAKRTGYQANTETNTLNKMNAQEEQKLVEARASLMKKKLEQEDYRLDDSFKQDYLNIVSGSVQSFNENFQQLKDPKQQARLYQQTINNIASRHPKGYKAGIAELRKQGVTPQMSREGLTGLQTYGNYATHDIALAQWRHKQHLLAEWEYEKALASAKKDNTRPDIKPMSDDEIAAVGKSFASSGWFDKLDGSYEQDINEWTGGKGRAVNYLGPLIRDTRMDLQYWQIPINESELVSVASDITGTLYKELEDPNDAGELDMLPYRVVIEDVFNHLKSQVTMLKDASGRSPSIRQVWNAQREMLIERNRSNLQAMRSNIVPQQATVPAGSRGDVLDSGVAMDYNLFARGTHTMWEEQGFDVKNWMDKLAHDSSLTQSQKADVLREMRRRGWN